MLETARTGGELRQLGPIDFKLKHIFCDDTVRNTETDVGDFDAIMKTSWRIMDPKREGRSEVLTVCIKPLVARHSLQHTRAPQPRSAMPGSTLHRLSGQVHANQKPNFFSIDAKSDAGPVRREFSPDTSCPKHRQPVHCCPEHLWAEWKAWASGS